MATEKDLEEYLISNNGYLLDSNNNGKTIMISGAWGSGKTHFWQNEIEPILNNKLKIDNRANIYVSLYGKDSLKEIKQEVFLKASNEKDLLSKEIETFGFDVMSSILSSDTNWAKAIKLLFDLNKVRKNKKGKNRLEDGGIICFDDFERKSKNVDLNDLFGFISQLAIELKCKVIIILNSDVFEGKEANVFKAVKEKTINKFFYFEPTIEELFTSIYNSDEKYQKLDEYKDEILKSIIETKELNARIYIQVLDNCLEWIWKGYEHKGLHALILTTLFFIFTNKVLNYSKEVDMNHLEYMGTVKSYKYDILKKYHKIIQKMSIIGRDNEPFEYKDFNTIKNNIHNEVIRHSSSNSLDIYPDEIKKIVLNQLENNKKELSIIWKYGYQLYYMDTIDEHTYNIIKNFVKTGILINKNNSENI